MHKFNFYTKVQYSINKTKTLENLEIQHYSANISYNLLVAILNDLLLPLDRLKTKQFNHKWRKYTRM